MKSMRRPGLLGSVVVVLVGMLPALPRATRRIVIVVVESGKVVVWHSLGLGSQGGSEVGSSGWESCSSMSSKVA